MRLSILQQKFMAAIFLVSSVNMFVGCHHYYRAVKGNTTSTETKRSTIDELRMQKKTFILRQGSKSYLLKNLTVDDQKMIISATMDTIPRMHTLYVTPHKKQIYKKAKAQDAVLNEVHIYVPAGVSANSGQGLSLNMGDIEKIEIIQKDAGKTTTSFILGGLGYTLGALTLISVIILLTKDSCPFVSTYDGEQYNLQGEMFGGAIYPSLQREDFVPLQINAVSGEYILKISNELKERQYSDYANLLVVDHDKNAKVLSDLNGQLFSVTDPQLPTSAYINQRKDVLHQVKNMDNISCLFDDEGTPDNLNELYLSFDNTYRSSKGKLVLNLKNSYWADYLYGEFTKHFGSYYNKWIKGQKKKPANEMDKWAQEQNIPMTVSVKVNNEWKEIRNIKTIGPLLNRQIVIPVPISKNEKVEIKLSTGFMFWEVDYAALDVSTDQPFSVQEIKPYEAADGKGANVLTGLLMADRKFLQQPNTGDVAIIKYKSPNLKEGMERTVLLHTSGYYEHVRNYTGKPDIPFLKSFSKPGAFQAFSKQRYHELKNAQLNLAKN